MGKSAFFQRWHLLTQAERELQHCDSLTQVLEVLRERTRAIAAADGVAVVRREGAEVVYVGEDAIAPLWTGRRFAIETCVSGLAILQRSPIVIPDIRADDRVPLNAYLATFVQSMALFPVGSGNPVAALGCYWAEVRTVGEDLLYLFASLTRSANASLERLAIHRERDQSATLAI